MPVVLKEKATNKVKHKKIAELKRDKLSTSSSISDDEEALTLKRKNSLKSRRSSSDGSHTKTKDAQNLQASDEPQESSEIVARA